MARHTRKGRNPGPVDEWLDTIGYYRKNVAYDETCLFRAASEQLFSCQLFHETIRKACIDYGRKNYNEFDDIMATKNDWDIYLDQLEKHMAVCGNTEIQLISKTYKRGIIIFDSSDRSVKEISNGYMHSEFLLLCHMCADHYDVVYKKELIQNAGFCQSIIYGVLYENVFKISNVPKIVDVMLYQKTPSVISTILSQDEKLDHQSSSEANMLLPSLKFKELSIKSESEENLNEYEYLLRTNIAPFPFKIAKALDPTIYRNIEYDTWTEMRKEMRLGEWYYGDNNLVKGSACIFEERNGEEMHCYIQEIFKEENKCLIYITSLAEKRTVSFAQLKPESDAKPWPVPYRFAKNLTLTLPKAETILERRFRKKKEKRTIGKHSNESENGQETTDNQLIRMLEGAPLHVTETNATSNIKFEDDVSLNGNNLSRKFESSSDVDNALILEESSNPSVETNANDSMAWPQLPQLPLPNSYPTNVATTPNEGYQDQLYYYPTGYQQYNMWANGEYIAPLPQQNSSVPITPQPFEYPQTPDVINFLFNDVCYSPTVPQNYSQPQVYAQSPAPLMPIIITSPEVTDFGLQSPVQPPPQQLSVYSPTVRMPYVQMSTFVYPPTPPPTWYMTGVNPQGFVFPAVNQNNN